MVAGFDSSIGFNMNPSRMAFWLKEFAACPTVVVANGEVPSSELSLNILKTRKRVVCCDGALQKLLSVNIIPDLVVGDGDSMHGQLSDSITDSDTPDEDSVCRVCAEGHQIPYYPDKSEEYNDLQKALKHCMANGYNDVLLLGCGGLREDHFIANLSILVMYSAWIRLAMLTEHGVFDIIRGEGRLNAFPGMQVSVFPRNPKIPITFEGLKYPVQDRCFTWLWEGSLNEAVGESFTVRTPEQGMSTPSALVYRTLQPSS